jgi:hypothetical protein
LPHLSRIQQLFGRHDVSRVEAHIGGPAVHACQEMAAVAFATGNHVVFREPPDLHTAAHEAAHVVQQRVGVHVHAGVGAAGDRYERNADLVADAVVAGQSAEALLDDAGPHAGARPGGASGGAASPQGAAPQAKVESGSADHAPCTTCGAGACECGGAAKQTGAVPQPGGPVQKIGAASAVVQFDLRPPGNCTQDQWYALQQVVKQNCKTNMPRACAEGDSPETIADKAAHFGRCIAARTTLNNTCFAGGDAGHLEELGNLTRGLTRCERLRVPVPLPQPAPEEERRTSPEADRTFMERMAALTGLSGAALIAYLVISEGSRLFPPRNLIPVP